MGGLCMAVALDGNGLGAAVLEAMPVAAAHRAFDGTRTWSGRGAAAAHLGFELTPQDRGDRQPLVDGSIVCVCDARLDNRDSLVPSLQQHGYLGSKEPADSEVVLAAYRRWETDCPRHLLGDFAFAIWDAAAQRLFAARDAMGARTLYYRIEPRRRALLASEVKQILAAPGVPRVLNETAVLADIADLAAPADTSHYAGIDQLAPAHALLIEPGAHRTWRYWDVDLDHRIRYRDVESYAEHFGHLLSQAVGARLRSDRPVGMFLSGGLDSTAVAATAARLLDQTPAAGPLRGFSWAFEELRDMDERHVSGPLAAELGIPVTDVCGDDAWPMKDLPQHGPDEDDPYVWLFQPLFDRTLAAAQQVGVRTMLTADRGDEMTGGWVYDDFSLLMSGRLRMLNADRIAYRQRTGRSDLDYLGERLLRPLATSVWAPGSDSRLRRGARRLLSAPVKPLAPWVPDAAARRLGLHDVLAAAMPVPRKRAVARLHRYLSLVDPRSRRVTEMRQRTFARAGLQHADPWNDRRIVEFVCAVPQWVVQRQSEPKRITRAAVRGLLPEPALSSPAPSNTYPLFHRAFDERETHTVRELMRNSRAADLGLLEPAAVLASYEAYLRREDPGYDFWFPLTVELWLRRWWA